MINHDPPPLPSPPQTQPDADVLAVQPQDAALLQGDHWDAAWGPPPLLPGGVLLLQRGEQATWERGLWPGHGEHGEHPAGPVILLSKRSVFRQRRGLLGWPEGQLRGAPHPLHTHERGQDQRTNTGLTPVQPLITNCTHHTDAIDINIYIFCFCSVILYRSHFYHTFFRGPSKHISGRYFFLLRCHTHYSMSEQGCQTLCYIWGQTSCTSLLRDCLVFVLLYIAKFLLDWADDKINCETDSFDNQKAAKPMVPL